MTTLGMPTSMFLVFVATVLAGSLGAIHYTIVHVILGKAFSDEMPAPTHEPNGDAGTTEGGGLDG